MSYPHKLHFRERSRPQLDMGRGGARARLRADGPPLLLYRAWSGGVPRVSKGGVL